MSAPARIVLVLLTGALTLSAAVWMMSAGFYGLTLFAVAPVLIGGVAAMMLTPKSYGQAAARGAFVVTCLSCSLLLVRVEGLLCIAMTLPLAIPLGAIGGALAYRLTNPGAGARSLMAVALLPVASLTFDINAVPEVFEVRTAVEIAAPPERVWGQVIAFPELPEPSEWYFRSGIAYPTRARLEGAGVHAVRYCEFSTGAFVEPIEVWDEPRLLRFSVTESPAPMTELSPYAELVPGHLRGYFKSKQGQFRLIPKNNGRTLLEGTTWYQHGLWPAQYWRWWSDAIIHRIHLRVLNHIKALSE